MMMVGCRRQCSYSEGVGQRMQPADARQVPASLTRKPPMFQVFFQAEAPATQACAVTDP
jgi:hypothetical protein